jgi:hypothetical protein
MAKRRKTAGKSKSKGTDWGGPRVIGKVLARIRMLKTARKTKRRKKK